MAKTHYGQCEPATESDNQEYWSATYCGIEETEAPMTNQWEFVTCKNCLRVKPSLTQTNKN